MSSITRLKQPCIAQRLFNRTSQENITPFIKSVTIANFTNDKPDKFPTVPVSIALHCKARKNKILNLRVDEHV